MKVARAHLEGALCFLKSNKSSGSNAAEQLSRAKSGVRRLGKSLLFFRLDFERVRQKGVILRGDEMFGNEENKWFDEKQNYMETKVSRWELDLFLFLLMVHRVFVSIRLSVRVRFEIDRKEWEDKIDICE